MIKPTIHQQMQQNAKECQEIPKNAKKSKRFDSTKRFGSGPGFFEAPVHYDMAKTCSITKMNPCMTALPEKFHPIRLRIIFGFETDSVNASWPDWSKSTTPDQLPNSEHQPTLRR